MNESRLGRIGLIAGVIYGIVFLFVCAILIGSVLSLKANVVYHWTDLRPITDFTLSRNGQADGDIGLPATLSGLSPGEQITLTTSIDATIHDNILVKTSGVALSMYVDDSLYLALGLEGSFPAFQKTPPPNIAVVPMPETAGTQLLRFEYTVPAVIDRIELPVIYVGDSQMLFLHLLTNNGLNFAFVLLLLLGGIVLIGMGLVIATRVPAARSLFWLGFACLATGVWGLCSNDLTLYLIPFPSLLYTLSHIGLFSIGIPFLKYGSLLLAPVNHLLMDILYNLMRLALLATLLLHLTGVFPFAYSAPVMQFMTPAALAIFTGSVIVEYFGRHNIRAARFGPAVAVFALFALASALNISLHFLEPVGILLQTGVLVFAIWMAILGWGYIRDVFDEAEKAAMLQMEISTMNKSLDMQRTLYNNLTQSTEEVRALRHDLRHQLSAIRGYLQTDDVDGALTYVETIAGSIPEIANKLLCDNFAVNAVAVHYLDKALGEGIQTDIRLVVPADLGRVPDNDMSIIVGNLFENAIEACLYVSEDKRFIRIQSSVVKNRLTLVIDNSFDGSYKVVKGNFYSRKRDGKGIGISSVRTVVEKYDGSLKYEAANGVFMTSLYVKM
ncbi:MAG: GHKL domain-containing protein [Coriobacteriales bacterium]|jgi:hypothetical protein|nr:GHKL domain-containing protein [Coriobacteriales bacterium]